MLKDIATDVGSNFYDETLSETSVNAVQNKVITQALNKKADKTELSKKQDVISDLNEIRTKVESALQSVPSEYITEDELNIKNFATKSDVALVNTSLSNTNAKFVDYYTKDQANVKFQPKGNYLTEHQDISGKQDKIEDLEQIRSNAQKGATALQTVPSKYATKTYVSEEVAKIVNSAPEAFNTLKEIADWIEEDAEPAIVLANKVEQKVDKVEGLGLSEENYTTEEKAKLAGLENYDDAKLKEELFETYQPKGDYVETKNLATINGKPLNEGGNIEIESGSGGASIEVDSSLSTTSTNPVQNKVITAELNKKAETGAIPTKLSQLTDNVGFAKQADVEAGYQHKGDYVTDDKLSSKGYATEKYVDDALEGKQDTIEDLDSIRSGAGKGATAVQPSALANYATAQQLTELSEEVSKKVDADFVNNAIAESLGTIINGDY